MKLLFFVALLSLFPAVGSQALPAVGLQTKEPTYLSCDIGDQHYDYTADEQRGTISVFNQFAHLVYEERASFQPGYVIWRTNPENGNGFAEVEKIDRVDLSLTEVGYVGGKETSRHAGTCTIKPVPIRKF